MGIVGAFAAGGAARGSIKGIQLGMEQRQAAAQAELTKQQARAAKLNNDLLETVFDEKVEEAELSVASLEADLTGKDIQNTRDLLEYEKEKATKDLEIQLKELETEQARENLKLTRAEVEYAQFKNTLQDIEKRLLTQELKGMEAAQLLTEAKTAFTNMSSKIAIPKMMLDFYAVYLNSIASQKQSQALVMSALIGVASDAAKVMHDYVRDYGKSLDLSPEAVSEELNNALRANIEMILGEIVGAKVGEGDGIDFDADKILGTLLGEVSDKVRKENPDAPLLPGGLEVPEEVPIDLGDGGGRPETDNSKYIQENELNPELARFADRRGLAVREAHARAKLSRFAFGQMPESLKVAFTMGLKHVESGRNTIAKDRAKVEVVRDLLSPLIQDTDHIDYETIDAMFERYLKTEMQTGTE